MEIALGDNITALFVYTSTFFLLLRGPRCPEAMDAWDEWTRANLYSVYVPWNSTHVMLLHMVVKSILSLTKYPLESALQSSSPERKAFSRLKKGRKLCVGYKKVGKFCGKLYQGRKVFIHNNTHRSERERVGKRLFKETREGQCGHSPWDSSSEEWEAELA